MEPVVTVAEFLELLVGVRKTANGWSARCPAHDDHTPSLAVAEGADGGVLVHCHAGCTVEAVTAAVGRTPRDLFADTDTDRHRRTPARPVAYAYRDEAGDVVFEVVRVGKRFRQRRPDGNGGWVWNVNGVRRVLYRLPEVVAGIAGGEAIWVAGRAKRTPTR